MLEELHIQNYLLIDRLVIRFTAGLNVLSGETGAGKSILLGALSLLLGERADADVIRSGCDECILSATFKIADGTVAHTWITEHGMRLEEQRLLVRRSIRRGRSTIHIQSLPATLQELHALATYLIDVHGQHEHQSLFRTAAHRRMVDSYGGLLPQVEQIRAQHAELITLQKRFDTLSSYQREHKHELELLEHAVTEINAAQLESGEDHRLQEEIKVLSQYEQLHGLSEEFQKLCTDSQRGVLSLLNKARITMEQLTKIDSGLIKLSERLDGSYYELEDIIQSAKDHVHGASYNTTLLRDKSERHDLISRLQMKYGDTIDKIQAYAREAEEQIEQLRSWEENKGILMRNINTLQQQVMAIALSLSTKRAEVAKTLEAQVGPIIRELGIKDGEFKIAVTQQHDESKKYLCGPTGIDSVEFLVRTNSGEQMRPLRKIASGGELSRIMLALKSILAKADRISAMIFDEIDAGIGGMVARAVGSYLQQLGSHKQVLCITHIASIAARATHHLAVRKITRGERTVTMVEELSDHRRVAEIARMLAGKSEDHLSLEHAEQLLDECSARDRQP